METRGLRVFAETVRTPRLSRGTFLSSDSRAGVPLFNLPTRSFDRFSSSWGVDATGERFFVLIPDTGAQKSSSIDVVTDFGSLVSRR